MELFKLAHKESRYQEWPFSEEMAKKMLTEAFAIKCTKNKDICGIFIGGITHMEFSPKPIGMQVLFWVKPRYRGTSAFYMMIRTFLYWCECRNAVPMISPHFAKDNTKTYKILEKLGLKEIGKIYSKEV